MGAVLPFDGARAEQPQIGLVNERGRLERVAWPLGAHEVSGKLAQVRVHQRDQLVGCPTAPATHLREQIHRTLRIGHEASMLDSEAAWKRGEGRRALSFNLHRRGLPVPSGGAR